MSIGQRIAHQIARMLGVERRSEPTSGMMSRLRQLDGDDHTATVALEEELSQAPLEKTLRDIRGQ